MSDGCRSLLMNAWHRIFEVANIHQTIGIKPWRSIPIETFSKSIVGSNHIPVTIHIRCIDRTLGPVVLPLRNLYPHHSRKQYRKQALEHDFIGRRASKIASFLNFWFELSKTCLNDANCSLRSVLAQSRLPRLIRSRRRQLFYTQQHFRSLKASWTMPISNKHRSFDIACKNLIQIMPAHKEEAAPPRWKRRPNSLVCACR